jgi:hypothetical protein
MSDGAEDDYVRLARLALAREAWTDALMAGEYDKADRCAAEVAALEADAFRVVACPSCEAGPGEPCRDGTAVFAVAVHASRAVAADE